MSAADIEMLVRNILTKVDQIEQALRGYNGQPGLIKNHEILKTDYFKFKRQVLMVFAFAVGSGVLGLSILKIVEAVK